MEGCVVGSANFISEKVEFLNVTLFNIHLFPVSQFCAMGGGWTTSQLSSLGRATDRFADIYFLLDLLIYIFRFLAPPQIYLLISIFLFRHVPPQQPLREVKTSQIRITRFSELLILRRRGCFSFEQKKRFALLVDHVSP